MRIGVEKKYWIMAFGSLIVVLLIVVASRVKVTYHVVWEPRTRVVVDSSGGTYPRLAKLNNGNWLIAYDTTSSNIHHRIQVIQISNDQGKHWGTPIVVAKSMTANIANGQVVQLKDGTLLCAYRVIGQTKEIEISRSSDDGKTWSYLSTVASAPQGVWEPFLYLNSDGQLQCFFSSEAFNQEYPQVIEMKRSSDSGKSWSRGIIVSANKHSRDGMATVATMNHEQKMFMTFEATDSINPFIIRFMTADGDGGQWSTRKLLYQPENWSKLASAPYVVSVNNNILVASFQTTGPSTFDDMKHSEMETLLSDDGGRKWIDPTYPFQLNVDKGQSGMWNSLFVPEGNTIVAASGIVENGVGTIQIEFGSVQKHYAWH